MNETDYPNYALIDENGGFFPHPVAEIGNDGSEGYGDPDTGADETCAKNVNEDDAWIFVPEEEMGYGWFDRRLRLLANGIELNAKKFYKTAPRAWDKCPTDIPADHPLRAIAKVLELAPSNSVIRVKVFVLTDWLAIDLLMHYGATHNVKIIMNYVHPVDDDEQDGRKKNTVKAIKAFLKFYERFQSYQLFNNISIRTANTMGGHCCKNGNTYMQEKVILTEHHAVYGSYNLSGYARCKHWESIRICDCLEEEKKTFDDHWNSLGIEREFKKYYPDRLPESNKRQRTS